MLAHQRGASIFDAINLADVKTVTEIVYILAVSTVNAPCVKHISLYGKDAF